MTAQRVIHGHDGIRILARAGLMSLLWLSGAAVNGQEADPPDTIQLTGIVRDFREWGAPEGHPDFEQRPDRGFGRYAGNVAATLADDGKPAYTGKGAKIAKPWRDAHHRAICHSLYGLLPRDIKGSWRAVQSTGGITSAETFSQWFHDTPGVNIVLPLTITLVRKPDGMYVFDDKEDPYYQELGGFFPIDGQLFGNSGDNNKDSSRQG